MEEKYLRNHFSNEWGNIWITLFMIHNIHFCKNQDINILMFYNIHDNVINKLNSTPKILPFASCCKLSKKSIIFYQNVPTFPFEPWKFSSFWFKLNTFCLLKNFLNSTSFIYPPSPLPSLKYTTWMKRGWWLIIPWNSIYTKLILFDENYLSLGIYNFSGGHKARKGLLNIQHFVTNT